MDWQFTRREFWYDGIFDSELDKKEVRSRLIDNISQIKLILYYLDLQLPRRDENQEVQRTMNNRKEISSSLGKTPKKYARVQ